MTLKHQIRLQDHWDKILFTLAGVYFILVLSWLIGQNKLQLPLIQTNQPTVTPQPLFSSDKAFIAYLQARLATLETANPSGIPGLNPAQTPKLKENLPTVSVDPPPTPPKPTQPSIIERVYLPLYPETPQITQPTPQPQVTPIQPKKAVLPPPPPPSPAMLKSVPVLTPNNPLSPQVTALKTGKPDTLVGTLADSDRSYAIFQIKGKPQQIRLGEFIGQSGWVLVGVENQNITLQKGSQKRYLRVGEEL